MGRAMCRVADGGTREESVVVADEVFEVFAVKCLPAWTSRMEVVGAEVRRERSWRRVGRVVSEGIVRGIAGEVG
jgi:hypothetical protein